MTPSVTVVAQEDFSTPWQHVPDLLLPAYGETWLMVGITMVLVVIIGTPLGVTLHNTSPLGLYPNPRLFTTLNTIVNVGRSLPFLILMAAIIPVTRFIVGTTIGIPAAIVPMTTAGVPFFARLVQNALPEVRSDVTDMGQASGGTTLQVIRTVQLSEALPALAGALTVNVIAMIEYSAIAGSIGAGGVGNLAITYGYNRFDDNIMIATAVTLIVTIQVVQFVGDRLVKALTR
ncbi:MULTISPECIES: methionine ABC transporter permease [unclassified Mycolicibacterium]|uniref:methionine ABC transporter permease n=1 Tax=unclassified Mycolicibacterium TaxID=2636767 RepID=UPI002ED8BDAE